MEMHKFAVTIHIEIPKEGMMKNEAEAKGNILDFLPVVAKALSEKSTQLVVSVPRDPIKLILE